MFSFQVEDTLYKALEKIAEEKDRSKSYIVRELITEYVQSYFDLKYARQVVADIESGRTGLINFKDVMKNIGIYK